MNFESKERQKGKESNLARSHNNNNSLNNGFNVKEKNMSTISRAAIIA